MWLHILTLASLLLPQPSGNPLYSAFHTTVLTFMSLQEAPPKKEMQIKETKTLALVKFAVKDSF